MNTNGIILASDTPLDHVVQHNLVVWGRELPVSNHVLMVGVAAVVMLVVMLLAARQRSMVPSGLRNLIEMICSFIRDEVARPALGDHTDRFVKHLWTLFFFILTCNLLGMIPVDSIVYLLSFGRLQHFGGTVTANIWVTGAVAATSFVMMPICGIAQQGVRGYVKNFIPNVPIPLMPLMYTLEVLGMFVKPFALSIRLFANMLAGHTVIGAFLGLIFLSRSLTVGGVTVVACAVLSLLELFVAFLQAYIFTFLTAMFIGASVNPEH